MSVIKPLVKPETVETKEGIRKVTHEAYCYSITPFLNPPIKVITFKGFIDPKGQFRPVTSTQTSVDITPDEFKELLNPNPQGKRAGDFRISDIHEILSHREKIVEVHPS